MSKTMLAELIDRQVQASLVTTIGRTAERAAEELAADLLKDPSFRDEMRALIHEAFRRALVSLQAETER